MPPSTDPRRRGRTRAPVRTTPSIALAVVVLVAPLGVACTDDDASPPAPTIAGVPDRVPLPPAEEDQFCDAIVELDARASDDPPTPDEVLAVYDRLVPIAPSEIADDFETVRRAVAAAASSGEGGMPLDATQVDTTTDDAPELDGAAELDDAAERLSIWLDEVCRGTDRSPLPPPTQPGDGTE